MFDAAPPPPRPAIVRAASLDGLPSWRDMQRRETMLREATFPFPMRPRQNASITLTDSGSDTADANNYSFAGRSFGAADPSRHIIAGVVVTGVNASTFSTVSIGGVAATQIIERTNSTVDIALYIAAVPTGTTGNVNLLLSASKGRAACFVWRVVGLRSAAASASGGATSSGGAVALNIPAFGFAVAVGADNTSTSITFAGLTKDTGDLGPEGIVCAGASGNVSQQSSVNVSATFGSPSIPAMCCASFR